MVPSVSKNSTFRTPAATYPTTQHHTSHDLNYYHVFATVLQKFRILLFKCLLRRINCDDHYPKSTWEQHTLITLFNISPQNSVLKNYRHILHAHFSNNGYNIHLLHITLSIIWLEVLRQTTVNNIVFKNIMLCSLVANVAIIHKNLLPSYGEDRSACSPNKVVPVYSKTQHHIQQDRILHDSNYFLSLKESYNFKIHKSQSKKASWRHTSKKQTV